MAIFNKKKPDQQPVVLAVFGDTHVNSTVALPPGHSFPLDDGGMIKPSRSQLWILDCWNDYWAQVNAQVEAVGGRLWVVANGDLVEGNHHGTVQIHTKNENTQMRMATHLLDPIAQRAERFFVVRGTGVHVGPAGGWDERIAQDLGATPDPGVIKDDNGNPSRYSWWVLRMQVHGTKFVIAHHTTKGRLPWTRGNSANKLAARTLMTYAEAGDTIPDVVIRSHVHSFEDSGQNHRVLGILNGCWQLSTEYGNKISPDSPPDIGGIYFTLYPDRPFEYGDFKKKHYREKPRTWIGF